jgi:hypothetical protein
MYLNHSSKDMVKQHGMYKVGNHRGFDDLLVSNILHVNAY